MEIKKEAGLVIPFESLSSDALEALVGEFILREGTDYGMDEVPLERKLSQVLAQLKSGKVLVVYDASEESCSLVRKEGFRIS